MESDLAFELEIASAVAEAIGSPRALGVMLLVKYQEWAQLLDLVCDHRDYQDAGTFADDYLITELLKKSMNLPTGIDTAAVATSAFFEAEAGNAQTNERFSITDAVDHPEWWWRAEKYLRRILGPLDQRAFDQIENLAAHGPGSAVGLVGDVVPSTKYDSRPTVTERLASFARSLMPESWWDYHSIGPGPRVVQGNRFFTVLKNAKTDRGCAKGPILNVWIQKGIGAYIMLRLVLFGIDLRDQTWNRVLAEMARLWQLATIDLKQASDYTASVPTLQLLPDRWGHLLDLVREHVTEVPAENGTWRPVLLQKFCAMGNGFTFALQSAIFLSVVRAVVPPAEHSLTSVFGDDIICPQRYAGEVCTALEYLGFKVNLSKTCLAGSFFESCGTDWFHDQNVRPFYLRRARSKDSDLLEHAGADSAPYDGIPYPLQVANALRLWAQRRAKIDGHTGCDARFLPIWRDLVAKTPKFWRRPVPVEFGDSGFIVSYDEASDRVWTTKIKPFIGLTSRFGPWADVTGWDGFAISHVVLSPITVDRRSYGVVLANIARPPQEEQRLVRWRLGGPMVPVNEIPEDDDAPSYGLEPVRGQYGRPVAKWSAHVGWTEGFDWVQPNRDRD
jgi:hypothetical protein